MRSHVRPGSFPLLLVAGLLTYVMNGWAVESPTVALLGRLVVACAGIYVLSASRITLWLAVLLVAFLIASDAPFWPLDTRVTRVLQDTLASTFLLWVLVVVLREVFRPATRDRVAIVGALCGFLLILLIFMRVHGLIEAWHPDSYRTEGLPFSERSSAKVVSSFQYFSTITLTTVGYGDIVPVTAAARLVTGLEAISGQLYLAVVIATLVGRVAAGRK
jgi:hypothetical protein